MSTETEIGKLNYARRNRNHELASLHVIAYQNHKYQKIRFARNAATRKMPHMPAPECYKHEINVIKFGAYDGNKFVLCDKFDSINVEAQFILALPSSISPNEHVRLSIL